MTLAGISGKKPQRAYGHQRAGRYSGRGKAPLRPLTVFDEDGGLRDEVANDPTPAGGRQGGAVRSHDEPSHVLGLLLGKKGEELARKAACVTSKNVVAMQKTEKLRRQLDREGRSGWRITEGVDKGKVRYGSGTAHSVLKKAAGELSYVGMGVPRAWGDKEPTKPRAEVDQLLRFPTQAEVTRARRQLLYGQSNALDPISGSVEESSIKRVDLDSFIELREYARATLPGRADQRARHLPGLQHNRVASRSRSGLPSMRRTGSVVSLGGTNRPSTELRRKDSLSAIRAICSSDAFPSEEFGCDVASRDGSRMADQSTVNLKDFNVGSRSMMGAGALPVPRNVGRREAVISTSLFSPGHEPFGESGQQHVASTQPLEVDVLAKHVDLKADGINSPRSTKVFVQEYVRHARRHEHATTIQAWWRMSVGRRKFLRISAFLKRFRYRTVSRCLRGWSRHVAAVRFHDRFHLQAFMSTLKDLVNRKKAREMCVDIFDPSLVAPTSSMLAVRTTDQINMVITRFRTYVMRMDLVRLLARWKDFVQMRKERYARLFDALQRAMHDIEMHKLDVMIVMWFRYVKFKRARREGLPQPTFAEALPAWDQWVGKWERRAFVSSKLDSIRRELRLHSCFRRWMRLCMAQNGDNDMDRMAERLFFKVIAVRVLRAWRDYADEQLQKKQTRRKWLLRWSKNAASIAYSRRAFVAIHTEYYMRRGEWCLAVWKRYVECRSILNLYAVNRIMSGRLGVGCRALEVVHCWRGEISYSMVPYAWRSWRAFVQRRRRWRAFVAAHAKREKRRILQDAFGAWHYRISVGDGERPDIQYGRTMTISVARDIACGWMGRRKNTGAVASVDSDEGVFGLSLRDSTAYEQSKRKYDDSAEYWECHEGMMKLRSEYSHLNPYQRHSSLAGGSMHNTFHSEAPANTPASHVVQRSRDVMSRTVSSTAYLGSSGHRTSLSGMKEAPSSLFPTAVQKTASDTSLWRGLLSRSPSGSLALDDNAVPLRAREDCRALWAGDVFLWRKVAYMLTLFSQVCSTDDAYCAVRRTKRTTVLDPIPLDDTTRMTAKFREACDFFVAAGDDTMGKIKMRWGVAIAACSERSQMRREVLKRYSEVLSTVSARVAAVSMSMMRPSFTVTSSGDILSSLISASWRTLGAKVSGHGYRETIGGRFQDPVRSIENGVVGLPSRAAVKGQKGRIGARDTSHAIRALNRAMIGTGGQATSEAEKEATDKMTARTLWKNEIRRAEALMREQALTDVDPDSPASAEPPGRKFFSRAVGMGMTAEGELSAQISSGDGIGGKVIRPGKRTCTLAVRTLISEVSSQMKKSDKPGDATFGGLRKGNRGLMTENVGRSVWKDAHDKAGNGGQDYISFAFDVIRDCSLQLVSSVNKVTPTVGSSCDVADKHPDPRRRFARQRESSLLVAMSGPSGVGSGSGAAVLGSGSVVNFGAGGAGMGLDDLRGSSPIPGSMPRLSSKVELSVGSSFDEGASLLTGEGVLPEFVAYEALFRVRGYGGALLDSEVDVTMSCPLLHVGEFLEGCKLAAEGRLVLPACVEEAREYARGIVATRTASPALSSMATSGMSQSMIGQMLASVDEEGGSRNRRISYLVNGIMSAGGVSDPLKRANKNSSVTRADMALSASMQPRNGGGDGGVQKGSNADSRAPGARDFVIKSVAHMLFCGLDVRPTDPASCLATGSICECQRFVDLVAAGGRDALALLHGGAGPLLERRMDLLSNAIVSHAFISRVFSWVSEKEERAAREDAHYLKRGVKANNQSQDQSESKASPDAAPRALEGGGASGELDAALRVGRLSVISALAAWRGPGRGDLRSDIEDAVPSPTKRQFCTLEQGHTNEEANRVHWSRQCSIAVNFVASSSDQLGLGDLPVSSVAERRSVEDIINNPAAAGSIVNDMASVVQGSGDPYMERIVDNLRVAKFRERSVLQKQRRLQGDAGIGGMRASIKDTAWAGYVMSSMGVKDIPGDIHSYVMLRIAPLLVRSCTGRIRLTSGVKYVGMVNKLLNALGGLEPVLVRQGSMIMNKSLGGDFILRRASQAGPSTASLPDAEESGSDTNVDNMVVEDEYDAEARAARKRLERAHLNRLREALLGTRNVPQKDDVVDEQANALYFKRAVRRRLGEVDPYWAVPPEEQESHIRARLLDMEADQRLSLLPLLSLEKKQVADSVMVQELHEFRSFIASKKRAVRARRRQKRMARAVERKRSNPGSATASATASQRMSRVGSMSESRGRRKSARSRKGSIWSDAGLRRSSTSITDLGHLSGDVLRDVDDDDGDGRRARDSLGWTDHTSDGESDDEDGSEGDWIEEYLSLHSVDEESSSIYHDTHDDSRALSDVTAMTQHDPAEKSLAKIVRVLHKAKVLEDRDHKRIAIEAEEEKARRLEARRLQVAAARRARRQQKRGKRQRRGDGAGRKRVVGAHTGSLRPATRQKRARWHK